MRFNLKDTEYTRIATRDEIGSREMEGMWYGAKEFAMMRKNRMYTLKLIKQGTKLDDENDLKYCSRGLETCLQDGSGRIKKQERKEASKNALFQEQSRQRHNNCFDQSTIAKVVQAQTTEDVHEAIERGKQDAVAAGRKVPIFEHLPTDKKTVQAVDVPSCESNGRVRRFFRLGRIR